LLLHGPQSFSVATIQHSDIQNDWSDFKALAQSCMSHQVTSQICELTVRHDQDDPAKAATNAWIEFIRERLQILADERILAEAERIQLAQQNGERQLADTKQRYLTFAGSISPHSPPSPTETLELAALEADFLKARADQARLENRELKPDHLPLLKIRSTVESQRLWLPWWPTIRTKIDNLLPGEGSGSFTFGYEEDDDSFQLH